MKAHPTLKGFFTANRLLGTLNLLPGSAPFGERLLTEEGREFRIIDPRRSKLGAAVVKGIKELGLCQGQVVLYLGAAHGYTASFVSDIVGSSGFVFALDFAPRVVRQLYFVCSARTNMAPILADAARPERYVHLVTAVDLIYQDIAQPNQLEIFLKNKKLFLKPGGYAIIAVKARSIDITARPETIFERVKTGLLAAGLELLDWKSLDPMQRAHAMFVCRTRE